MTLCSVLLLVIFSPFHRSAHCKIIGNDVDNHLLDPINAVDFSSELVDVVNPGFVESNLNYLGSYDDSHEERSKKSADTPVCIQTRCLDLFTSRSRVPLQGISPMSVTVVNLQPQALPQYQPNNFPIATPISDPRNAGSEGNNQQSQQPVNGNDEGRIIFPNHSKEQHPLVPTLPPKTNIFSKPHPDSHHFINKPTGPSQPITHHKPTLIVPNQHTPFNYQPQPAINPPNYPPHNLSPINYNQQQFDQNSYQPPAQGYPNYEPQFPPESSPYQNAPPANYQQFYPPAQQPPYQPSTDRKEQFSNPRPQQPENYSYNRPSAPSNQYQPLPPAPSQSYIPPPAYSEPSPPQHALPSPPQNNYSPSQQVQVNNNQSYRPPKPSNHPSVLVPNNHATPPLPPPPSANQYAESPYNNNQEAARYTPLEDHHNHPPQSNPSFAKHQASTTAAFEPQLPNQPKNNTPFVPIPQASHSLPPSNPNVPSPSSDNSHRANLPNSPLQPLPIPPVTKRTVEATAIQKNSEAPGEHVPKEEAVIAIAKGPMNFFEDIKPVDTEANEKEFRSQEPQPMHINLGAADGQRQMEPFYGPKSDQLGIDGPSSRHHGPPTGIYSPTYNAAPPTYQSQYPVPVNYYPPGPESQQYGNYQAPPLYQAPPCDCGNTFNIYQSPAYQTPPQLLPPITVPPKVPYGPPPVPQPQEYAPPPPSREILPLPQAYAAPPPAASQVSQEYYPTIPCSQNLIFSCAPKVEPAPCNPSYNGDLVPQFNGYSSGPINPPSYVDANQPAPPPPPVQSYIPPAPPSNPYREPQSPYKSAEKQPQPDSDDKLEPAMPTNNNQRVEDKAGEKVEVPDEEAREQIEQRDNVKIDIGEEEITPVVPAIVREITTTSIPYTQVIAPKNQLIPGAPFGMGWKKSDPLVDKKRDALTILEDLKEKLKFGKTETLFEKY